MCCSSALAAAVAPLIAACRSSLVTCCRAWKTCLALQPASTRRRLQTIWACECFLNLQFAFCTSVQQLIPPPPPLTPASSAATTLLLNSFWTLSSCGLCRSHWNTELPCVWGFFGMTCVYACLSANNVCAHAHVCACGKQLNSVLPPSRQ